jgi:hypothetical protein
MTTSTIGTFRLPPGIALLAYALGGLLLGFCNRPLNLIAQRYGIRPGIGTALNVNILMPLLVAALAIFHRRAGIAVLGAVIATIMFHLAFTFVQQPHLSEWSARTTIAGIHPILVAACLGYAVIGAIAAVVAASFRVRAR